MQRRSIAAAVLAVALATAALAACSPGGDPEPAPRTERERREALTLGWVKPDATNTGVLPDVPRTAAASEIVNLDQPGTVYENKDVPCMIRIRAARVTIRNVSVRGACSAASGQPSPTGTALINAWHPAVDDAVIEHVTLQASVPSPKWVGIHGHDFTLRFSDISHVVDGVGVWNTNVTPPYQSGVVIRQNYIHDLSWFTGPTVGVVHPADTETHNDAIQHQGGVGSIIEGNNLVARYARQVGHWRTTGTSEPYTTVPLRSLPDGGPYQPIPDRGDGTEATGRYNFDDIACMMIGDDVGPTYSLQFSLNWCSGGRWPVNADGDAPYNGTVRLGTLVLNRFDRSAGAQGTGGDNTYTISVNGWAGRVELGVGTQYANLYEDNAHEVNVRGD